MADAPNSETAIEKTGLFPVCYQIGGNMPGAPLFSLQLLVNTPAHSVVGVGHITQAIHPPLDVATQVYGDYTYMTVMPQQTHILVVATGQVPEPPPIIAIEINAHLRMVLAEDWQSGTANYRYLKDGKWHEVKNAPVKIVPCPLMPS